MTDQRIARWPRALQLLRAVLAADPDACETLLPKITESDWHAFSDLAVERHKVAPAIVGQTPLPLPDETDAAIRAAAEANALQTLQQMSVTIRICRVLEDAGIAATVLKGWPLSERLFHSPSARQSRDIDLIVPREQMRDSVRILSAEGCIPDQEHLERHRILGTGALFDEINNLSFRDEGTRQLVELHWRCNQFSGWPELFNDGEGTEWQETSAGPLRVPAEQSNLIYLALHGSLHRWTRLKWLCDIAAIARQRGVSKLEADLRHAEQVGAGRALALALRLAHEVLHAPCPESARSRNPWLTARCLEEIARPNAAPTGLAHRLKFYAMTLALATDLRQRIGVLRYRLWGQNRIALATASGARG